MAVGRVVRFDGMRGYGFIAPEQGGEDVFLHVNDLLIPESSVRSGLAVEFEVENGGRGLKASSVRFAKDAEGAPSQTAESADRVAAAADGQEPMCDVLGSAEYTREVTELLLACVPDLTGQQILATRKQLVLFAKRHGWIED
ncbi:cold-shock protein [Streptomyces broussonetiae]|uniref:Cold shock domain-containing protein n=1 Tax=Streptomyces broussonetiae TaxID=2686304 RepID=A0A6I6N9I0_9ACTN|nr:cold shock domain-containing protein [Streptomyces broussonetiae]QHA08174.1 cold shock domain-containing protein [Streptomyces broussonetiae]